MTREEIHKIVKDAWFRDLTQEEIWGLSRPTSFKDGMIRHDGFDKEGKPRNYLGWHKECYEGCGL